MALYASGFRTVLVGRGYAPSSTAGQLQVMGHLSRWLAEHGRDGRDLTSAVVEEFLLVRRAAGYRQWLSMRGCRRCWTICVRSGSRPPGHRSWSATPVEIVLAAYETYLVEERGLSALTVRNYLSVARQFVSWRGGPEAAGFDGLTASEVSEFVLAACRSGRRGSGTLLVVGMRALLRYLHVAGITAMGLAGAVPPAAAWPSSLPQPIDRRSAAQLLASCDRRTAVGRRAFAVLTLLVRLGPRVSPKLPPVARV